MIKWMNEWTDEWMNEWKSPKSQTNLHNSDANLTQHLSSLTDYSSFISFKSDEHKTPCLRVMMSQPFHGPGGLDLWANLGLSLQIAGLCLPGELLMGQWDGGSMQQKSSPLLSTHRAWHPSSWSHTQGKKRWKNVDFILQHTHTQTFQTCPRTNMHTHTRTEANTE